MPCDGICGGPEILLGDEVRVDVVVGKGAVLVGACDAVDAETSLGVVVPERAPETRRLDQELEPDVVLELVVSGGGLVPDDGIRDVGADVERRRARRPVSGALVPTNRPPGERRACEPELCRPLAGEIERRVPPAERVGRGARSGVREHGKHEPLGVPERVTVVPRAGQPFRPDRPTLGSRAGLQRVEDPEPHGLLQLGIAFELDVRVTPEPLEVPPLALDQPLPAGVPGLRQRAHDLVSECRQGSLARPRVGEELDDAQRLADGQVGRDRHASEVPRALAVGVDALGPAHDVVHAGRQAELAPARRMDEHDPEVVARRLLGCQGRLEHGGGTRIQGLRGGGLVRQELRLDDDANRRVDGLDHVLDRRDRPLRERDEPGRPDADRGPGGRPPRQGAPQDTAAQVELALVRHELPVAEVERLVVDAQPDQLPVRHVDDRLAGLRVAVSGLGVGQRP